MGVGWGGAIRRRDIRGGCADLMRRMKESSQSYGLIPRPRPDGNNSPGVYRFPSGVNGSAVRKCLGEGFAETEILLIRGGEVGIDVRCVWRV